MDVFISWSGAPSKQVAEALRHYLPLMINAIQPWLSSADIDAGARWGADMAGKLQLSKVGIICLTPTNLESIWVHFEAGALAKTLENTYVCPYLVGIEPSDIKGPLTQFQAKRANEEDTRRLIETLNAALGEQALKAEQLSEAFSTYWPKLKGALDAVQEQQAPAQKRSERDILEELLGLARSQARIGFPVLHRKLKPGERAVIAVAAHLARAPDYEEIDKIIQRTGGDVNSVTELGDVAIFYLESPFVTGAIGIASLKQDLQADLGAKDVELIWLA